MLERAILLPDRLGIGQVATRGVLPTAIFADNTTWLSRTAHYACDWITSLAVCLPHWYVPLDDGGGETNGGGTQTFEASIEYPASTFTRLHFAGANTVAAAAGSTTWTDFTPVRIPRGAKFFIRVRRSGQTSLVYNNFPLISVAYGDALENTGTNNVMTGSVTDGSFGIQMFPLAIVALTRVPSFVIYGDSRQSGIGETSTSTGHCGELSRLFGDGIAYINMGVQGESGSHFVANSVKRRAVGKYCTHAAICYGANSIGSGAASVEADLRSAMALSGIHPRRIYATTLPPGLGTTERVSYNNWLRGRPAEIDGYFEIADTMETARDSGVWVAGRDSDGIHESTTGNLALVGKFDASGIPQADRGYMPRTIP